MSTYGYVRVSSREQNEDRQLDALRGMEIEERNILSTNSRERILSAPSIKGWSGR